MNYIKDRKWVFLIVCVCCCVYTALLFLYHVPIEALIYTNGLILLFFILVGFVDIYRYNKQHKRRKQLIKNPDVLEANTLIDHDYQQVIVALQESLKTTKEKNQQIQEDVQDYFTMWAHQMKLPIAAMKLLLEDEVIDRNACKGQLFRIEQYTSMVLAYLRLESKDTDYVFQEQALDPIITQVIHLFAGEFIRKKIRVDYTKTNQLVVTDSKWLQFVLEQIVSNALKYSLSNTCISIDTKANQLIIADQGIGIDEADQKRLFSKGFTGRNGRVDEKATGLGLYLCKEICSRMAIDIQIQSKVHQGTKVILTFTQKKMLE